MNLTCTRCDAVYSFAPARSRLTLPVCRLCSRLGSRTQPVGDKRP